ncbi:MAG: hypothetical protein CUN53_12890, partial [Phototrophicales bacterium]
MFSLIQKRRWFYLFSSALIIPGLVIMLYSLFTTGSLFRLGNEFIGGSIYELRFLEEGATEASIRQAFQENGNDGVTIQRLGNPEANRWSVRASFQETSVSQQIIESLNAIAPIDLDSLRVEQVSPTVGQEVTQSAILAVLVAAA